MDAIKYERDKAQLYLDIAGVMFVALNNKGNISMLNKMACDVLECKLEDTLQKNWFQMFIPEDMRDLVHDTYQKIMRGDNEHVKFYQNSIITTSGIQRLIQWHNAILKDEKGEIIGTLSSGLDITERHQAHIALQDSEAKWKSITEHSPNHITLIDLDGIIIFINRPIPDFELDEIIGKSVFSFTPLKFQDDMSTCFKQVMQTSEFSSYCTDFKLKDGKTRHFKVLVGPVMRENQVASLVTISFDITDQKMMNEKLEDLVEERTKELVELQKQLVMTERLTVLGQLSSGIGHELRNPLGSIKNSIYYLKMALENPEDEIVETLDILDQEVTNYELIIGSLLDFASPKAPIRQKTNLIEIINAALLRVDITEGIKLETDLDTKTPAIFADPTQLSQVFINLIRNAVQAMENGGKLSINIDTSELGYISIKITDTGSGITEENLQKLFTPLFTTKAKGIGLGLAISKSFIEAHDGTNDVKSSMDKGTSFEIKFPVGGNMDG